MKTTPFPWRIVKSQVGNYLGYDIRGGAPGHQRWIASVHSKHTPDADPEKRAEDEARAYADAKLILTAATHHANLLELLSSAGKLLAACAVDVRDMQRELGEADIEAAKAYVGMLQAAAANIQSTVEVLKGEPE